MKKHSNKRIELIFRKSWWSSRKDFAVIIIPSIWIEYDNMDKWGITSTIGIDWIFWSIQLWIEIKKPTK